jgi:hypothetical protein
MTAQLDCGTDRSIKEGIHLYTKGTAFILLAVIVTSVFGVDCDSILKIKSFSELLSRGIIRNPVSTAITHCKSKNCTDIMMVMEIKYNAAQNIYNVKLSECADYNNEIFGGTPIMGSTSNSEFYYLNSDEQLQREYKLQMEHPAKLLLQRKRNIEKFSNGVLTYKMPLDSIRKTTGIKFDEDLDCPSECSNTYKGYCRSGELIYVFQIVGYHTWELIDICPDCLPNCYKIDNYMPAMKRKSGNE